MHTTIGNTRYELTDRTITWYFRNKFEGRLICDTRKEALALFNDLRG
jgi:hypothetical protein